MSRKPAMWGFVLGMTILAIILCGLLVWRGFFANPRQQQYAASPPVIEQVSPITFWDAEYYLSDRPGLSPSQSLQWTELQKEEWRRNAAAKLYGLLVEWEGMLVDVDERLDLYLKCNPNTITFDVKVTLRNPDRQFLTNLRKGQRVRVRGRIQSHSIFGWHLVDGVIVAVY
jgi:hypothetical protein